MNRKNGIYRDSVCLPRNALAELGHNLQLASAARVEAVIEAHAPLRERIGTDDSLKAELDAFLADLRRIHAPAPRLPGQPQGAPVWRACVAAPALDALPGPGQNCRQRMQLPATRRITRS